MKTRIAVILAVFVILALGTVLVSAGSEATSTSWDQAVQGFTPMTGSCNFFCSKCISLGHNGACTSGKACC